MITSTSLAPACSRMRSRKNKVKHTTTSTKTIYFVCWLTNASNSGLIQFRVNQSRLKLLSSLMASCKRGKLKYSLNEFRSEFVFRPRLLTSNSSSNAVRDLILCACSQIQYSQPDSSSVLRLSKIFKVHYGNWNSKERMNCTETHSVLDAYFILTIC